MSSPHSHSVTLGELVRVTVDPEELQHHALSNQDFTRSIAALSQSDRGVKDSGFGSLPKKARNTTWKRPQWKGRYHLESRNWG